MLHNPPSFIYRLRSTQVPYITEDRNGGAVPWMPFSSYVFEFADQFLILRVHRDHRLTSLLKLGHGSVYVLELCVPIRMIAPSFVLLLLSRL
jgi:hypothetical protein